MLVLARVYAIVFELLMVVVRGRGKELELEQLQDQRCFFVSQTR